jgi:O-antigen/teichoic acid export membrane protein
MRLAKISAIGGLNLFWGLVVSSVISAVGIMVVAGILSEAEFGVVSIALIGPTIISYIRDLGIDQATIKYVTQYRTEEDKKKLKDVIITGTLFECVLGIVFTIVSFGLSGLMADLLDRPAIINLIQIASFTILAGALLKAAQSTFIGFDKMKLNSVTLVLQSIFKTGLMVVLVYFGYGEFGATVGNSLSFIAAGLIGVAFLYVAIIKKLQEKGTKLEIVYTLKTLLKFGLPLSIATTLVGVLSQYYSFFVAIYTPDELMGNYQVALSFAMLVSIFATSVATILFPTFSKVKGHEDQKTLSSMFQYSVKYTSLLIVPAAFAVMALSEPGVQTIFQDKYEYTPLYLALYVSTFLYSAIGNLSAGALINSQGQTQFNLKITVLTFILGIITSLVLIPYFGVIGLLIVHISVGMPGILISLWWINKHYKATIDWKSSTKIIVASALSGFLTYLVTSQMNLAGWITLIIGSIVFLSSYIIIAPLIGAITYIDIQNLKAMLTSLGPLATIINTLLIPIEKITAHSQKD